MNRSSKMFHRLGLDPPIVPGATEVAQPAAMPDELSNAEELSSLTASELKFLDPFIDPGPIFSASEPPSLPDNAVPTSESKVAAWAEQCGDFVRADLVCRNLFGSTNHEATGSEGNGSEQMESIAQPSVSVRFLSDTATVLVPSPSKEKEKKLLVATSLPSALTPKASTRDPGDVHIPKPTPEKPTLKKDQCTGVKTPSRVLTSIPTKSPLKASHPQPEQDQEKINLKSHMYQGKKKCKTIVTWDEDDDKPLVKRDSHKQNTAAKGEKGVDKADSPKAANKEPSKTEQLNQKVTKGSSGSKEKVSAPITPADQEVVPKTSETGPAKERKCTPVKQTSKKGDKADKQGHEAKKSKKIAAKPSESGTADPEESIHKGTKKMGDKGVDKADRPKAANKEPSKTEQLNQKVTKGSSKSKGKVSAPITPADQEVVPKTSETGPAKERKCTPVKQTSKTGDKADKQGHEAKKSNKMAAKPSESGTADPEESIHKDIKKMGDKGVDMADSLKTADKGCSKPQQPAGQVKLKVCSPKPVKSQKSAKEVKGRNPEPKKSTQDSVTAVTKGAKSNSKVSAPIKQTEQSVAPKTLMTGLAKLQKPNLEKQTASEEKSINPKTPNGALTSVPAINVDCSKQKRNQDRTDINQDGKNRNVLQISNMAKSSFKDSLSLKVSEKAKAKTSGSSGADALSMQENEAPSKTVEDDLNNNSFDFGNVCDSELSLSGVLDFSLSTAPLDLSNFSSFEKSMKTMSTPQIPKQTKNKNVKQSRIEGSKNDLGRENNSQDQDAPEQSLTQNQYASSVTSSYRFRQRAKPSAAAAIAESEVESSSSSIGSDDDSEGGAEWRVQTLLENDRTKASHQTTQNESDDGGSGSDEEDVVLSLPKTQEKRSKRKTATKKKKTTENTLDDEGINWTDNPIYEPERAAQFVPPPDDHLCDPYDYFQYFFDDALLEKIVEFTNIYSTFSSHGMKSLDLTLNELKQFLGIWMYMGVVKLHSMRDYWAAETNVPQVSRIMAFNRFQLIRTSLHLYDKTQEDVLDPNDRYAKVRLLLSHMKRKCNDLEQESDYSIDEAMVPYKGKYAGSLRQFIMNKPHKFGIKIFHLAGSSGIIYDFLPYAGKLTFSGISFSEQESEMGVGAKVVIHLARSVDNPADKALFFDNWFTSFKLVKHLKENMNLFSTGTVRSSRIEKCPLAADKVLKKRGRGSHDFKSRDGVGVTKWLDSKVVHVASSLAGVEPEGLASRCDKKTKQSKKISIPRVIQLYNSKMGGVDLNDMLVELNRTPTRAKRWYLSLIGYMMDVAVVNSWLLYRRHANSLNQLIDDNFDELEEESEREKVKPEYKCSKTFRLAISKRLRGEGPIQPNSTGPKVNKVIGAPRGFRPDETLRYDRTDHWATFKTTQGRCKFCKTGYTTVVCVKCGDISLCFVPSRQCFLKFHLKDM